MPWCSISLASSSTCARAWARLCSPAALRKTSHLQQWQLGCAGRGPATADSAMRWSPMSLASCRTCAAACAAGHRLVSARGQHDQRRPLGSAGGCGRRCRQQGSHACLQLHRGGMGGNLPLLGNFWAGSKAMHTCWQPHRGGACEITAAWWHPEGTLTRLFSCKTCNACDQHPRLAVACSKAGPDAAARRCLQRATWPLVCRSRQAAN